MVPVNRREVLEEGEIQVVRSVNRCDRRRKVPRKLQHSTLGRCQKLCRSGVHLPAFTRFQSEFATGRYPGSAVRNRRSSIVVSL